MKNKSLQWRATFLVSLLIAAICIIMNLLISYTNTFYIDNLSDYILGSDSNTQIQLQQDNGQPLDFYLDISNLLDRYQQGFTIKSWMITLSLTVIGGIVTYLLTGLFLRPLHAFTSRIENIHVKNLSQPVKISSADPDLNRLAHTFNAMLERLSTAFQSQKRFIGNAAHEFRTPLSIMQTKLELFCRQSDPSAEDCRQLAEALSVQTQNLSDLVGTLLTLSEMETVEMNDSVNLSDLAEEVLCDLSDAADAAKVELSQNTEPLTVTGNDILLYRLLFNLVENAVKYNKRGGYVRVSLSEEKGMAMLRVTDTGCGIPKDMWEEIMRPFYRVDKSRSRESGGIGLGLALVHEIALLHGGRIMVESSCEKGTVMLAALPLSK